MHAPLPSIGSLKSEIDTPALCLDIESFQRNIAAMAETCRHHGVDWRPHSKCHKSIEIARCLVDAGAIGVTCAKLGEAEVMASGGITDLLIANMIVGPQKIARLVELRKIADPIVCIDHIEQATPIAAAMQAAGLTQRVLIEIDIGFDRVGVQPGSATLELAAQLSDTPGIRLAGIMGYEGHLLTLEEGPDKRRRIHDSLRLLADAKDQLAKQGIPCGIVSCGGTGSFNHAVEASGITEIQAGGGIFMDAFYRHGCDVADREFALSVLTTIVSRPTPARAIIDAGRKTMDPNIHVPRVVNRDGIEVQKLSAEHGFLTLQEDAQELRIGDRVEVVPGYVDLTTMLHDQFLVFRGDHLEAIWTLDGRGRIQ